MILERMTDVEFERLTGLVEPQIPRIKEQTGLPGRFIREVLIVSAFLLAKENRKGLVPLEQYIATHCQRVASDLGVNLYDMRDVFEAWVIELVNSQNGKEDRA